MVRHFFPVAVAALLAGTSASAQVQTAIAERAPSITASAVGPTLSGARIAATVPVTALTAEEMRNPDNALQNRAGFGQPEALMIVGGAAFLAGAIIGGDPGTIVMIGGAGIGLYGLYLYLQ